MSGRVKIVETGRDGFPDMRVTPGRRRGAYRQAKARVRARVRRSLQRTGRLALRKGLRPIEKHERRERHVAPAMKLPLAIRAGCTPGSEWMEWGEVWDGDGFEEGRTLFQLYRHRRPRRVGDDENPF